MYYPPMVNKQEALQLLVERMLAATEAGLWRDIISEKTTLDTIGKHL